MVPAGTGCISHDFHDFSHCFRFTDVHISFQKMFIFFGLLVR